MNYYPLHKKYIIYFVYKKSVWDILYTHTQITSVTFL